MKVCTFDEFVKLPDGTLFSYWTPAIADGLYVKGDNYEGRSGKINDFLELSLLPGPDIEVTRPDVPLLDPDGWGRWGIYEFDQLFAVYESADLDVLANAVAEAKRVSHEH